MPKVTASSTSEKYAAPALDKGLDILEVLADAAQGMTLNGIAKVLNRTTSEIFRMVVTLQAIWRSTPTTATA
jgi:hypothetical protein